MEIAVLETGMVGRAIAGRLAGLGHPVVTGTRNPRQTLPATAGEHVLDEQYAGRD